MALRLAHDPPLFLSNNDHGPAHSEESTHTNAKEDLRLEGNLAELDIVFASSASTPRALMYRSM
jgi:hypothetical protein